MAHGNGGWLGEAGAVKHARRGRDKSQIQRERDARRAAALRENLRKRKPAARQRPDGDDGPRDEPAR